MLYVFKLYGVGCKTTDEFKRIWKETVVWPNRGAVLQLFRRNWDKSCNSSVGITRVLAEIRTKHLQNHACLEPLLPEQPVWCRHLLKLSPLLQATICYKVTFTAVQPLYVASRKWHYCNLIHCVTAVKSKEYNFGPYWSNIILNLHEAQTIFHKNTIYLSP